MMKPQKDKMMHSPAEKEVIGVDLVCAAEVVVPGRGHFTHGQRLTVTPNTAGELLKNPSFKRLKEVD